MMKLRLAKIKWLCQGCTSSVGLLWRQNREKEVSATISQTQGRACERSSFDLEMMLISRAPRLHISPKGKSNMRESVSFDNRMNPSEGIKKSSERKINGKLSQGGGQETRVFHGCAYLRGLLVWWVRVSGVWSKSCLACLEFSKRTV